MLVLACFGFPTALDIKRSRERESGRTRNGGLQVRPR